jgi:hypothetical protein
MQFFTHFGVNFVEADAVLDVDIGVRRVTRSNVVSAILLVGFKFIE